MNIMLPFLCLPIVVSAFLPIAPQNIFSNPSQIKDISKIPSSYESAVMARRILNLTPQGTLSTVFPTQLSSLFNAVPPGLAGVPIGLMDYIADCEPSGDPTILAINIATSFQNAAAGSNVSLALQWTPRYPPTARIKHRESPHTLPYSAANLPRFSLIGHLEKISEEVVARLKISKCFTKTHPDAKYWLPGNRIHRSEWVRLVVEQVFWIGGFGDRAFIGWIPIEDWRNVTKEEWQSIELPGEKKGWKEVKTLSYPPKTFNCASSRSDLRSGSLRNSIRGNSDVKAGLSTTQFFVI